MRKHAASALAPCVPRPDFVYTGVRHIRVLYYDGLRVPEDILKLPVPGHPNLTDGGACVRSRALPLSLFVRRPAHPQSPPACPTSSTLSASARSWPTRSGS